MKNHRKASTLYASAVAAGVFLIVIAGNKLLSIPIELMFFLVWLIVYPACMRLGYSFQEIDAGVMEACKSGLGAVLILLAVGALVSAWMAAGTVPAIIYFGLRLINPQVFLLLTFWICSVVSMVCGTSWGTMGTVGIAMFATGSSLGVPPSMTVGAIVSGSFLGDMLSPMGGSANVVSTACGVDLMLHCRELAKITLPVFGVASVFYYGLGTHFAAQAFEPRYVTQVMDALASQKVFVPIIFPNMAAIWLTSVSWSRPRICLEIGETMASRIPAV